MNTDTGVVSDAPPAAAAVSSAPPLRWSVLTAWLPLIASLAASASLGYGAALRIESWSEAGFHGMAWTVNGAAALVVALSRRSADARLLAASSLALLVASAVSGVTIGRAFDNNRMNWWVAEPFAAMFWGVGVGALGALYVTLRPASRTAAGWAGLVGSVLRWHAALASLGFAIFLCWTVSPTLQAAQSELLRWAWRWTHG